jgi:hypothetical protein
MSDDLVRAQAFVESIDLSGTPRRPLAQSAASEATEAFDAAKDQAQVVGSGLFSFVRGVTAETRRDISDSALLAQLVANKRFSAEKAAKDWYSAYQEVLQNVGWVVQDLGWADFTADGTAVEVNEKIIEVLMAALGPSAAALTIIKAAVDMLQKMSPGSSWFTIFNRESARANIARFQIGLVETTEEADLFVTLLACLIEAKSTMTQVLVFKFRNAQAKFEANSSKVSVNRDSLHHLGPAIRGKVRAYQTDYVSSIKDI